MRILGFEIKLPFFATPSRRRAERYGIFEALYTDYQDFEGKVRGTGPAEDLSVMGIRLLSDQKVAPGTRLTLTLRFTAGSVAQEVVSLQVLARVVRSYRNWRQKRFRLGCEFEGLHPDAQNIIQHFVNWLDERRQKYLFFRYQPPD